MDKHIKIKKSVKGSPERIEAACRALRAFDPPATNKAVATAPSVNAQKTLWIQCVFSKPFEAKWSTIRDPESDDVIK